MKITKEGFTRFCDLVIEAAFYLTIPAVTFSTSLVEITVSTMIGAWVLKNLVRRDISYMRTLPFVLLLLYAVWAVLSCFNSSFAKESFRGVFKVAEYGMLFVVTAGMALNARKILTTLYVMALSLVITSLNGFYQYFSGIDLIRHRELIADDYLRRISSSFVHPNDLGAYLLTLLIILLSVLISANRDLRLKIKMLAPAALSAVALIMTKSRGAWLSFVSGLFVLGGMISRRLIAVFAAGLIVVFLAMPQTARDRVFELSDLKSGTTWERIKLWEGTINMIKVHPVLGFGVNTYSRNFPQYRPADYPDVRYSHNCYLHMASEIGIPGAVFFILFILAVLLRGYRVSRKVDDKTARSVMVGLLAGVSAFALNAMVDTHLYSVSLAGFFYLLLGFLYALTDHARNAEDK